MLSQNRSQDSSKRTEIVKQYGELNTLLTTFTPDAQCKLSADVINCLKGDYPTLAKLKWYGENTPKAWLLPQLYDLSEYCGCRDKLQGRPLEQCAEVITATWHYLKMTELMLFFFRFKSGRYGKFYGAVDPMVITTALRDFVKERNIALEQIAQDERKKQAERDRKCAITYQEWQEIKKKRENAPLANP